MGAAVHSPLLLNGKQADWKDRGFMAPRVKNLDTMRSVYERLNTSLVRTRNLAFVTLFSDYLASGQTVTSREETAPVVARANHIANQFQSLTCDFEAIIANRSVTFDVSLGLGSTRVTKDANAA